MDSYRRLDFLKIGDKFGKKKSFFLYSSSIFSAFNLALALVLILIPLNSSDVQSNNMMIFAQRRWNKNSDLRKDLRDGNIVLRVMEDQSSLKQTIKQNENALISKETNKYNSNEKFELTEYYKWKYSTKGTNIYFSFQDENDNKFTFGDYSESSIKVKMFQDMSFDESDMIAQEMCKDKFSCHNECTQNGYSWETKEESFFCKGKYIVQELCAVMNFSSKKILRGCYKGGLFEKFRMLISNRQKKQIGQEHVTVMLSEITVQLFDQFEPQVKAFEISQSYKPYMQKLNDYQIFSKYCFMIGGSTSIMVLFSFIIFSIKKKDNIEQK